MGNRQSSHLCQCLSADRRRAHPQELQTFSHNNQTSSWVPPRENWDSGNGLPYGWEEAADKSDKHYYINHNDCVSSRDDPREDPDYIQPPKPRTVELLRDPLKGFGFVAGSEKPVIVRFVTDGGPSMDKLLPADQIIKINDEDVKKAPREHVIELVRACRHSITMTVCQPYLDNSSRKSALLTAAKKARLKSKPSRVRFSESVIVNGATVLTPSTQESYVPLMPNVLKVFLENGQTKSFKYDNKTTVKDVVNSLQLKLNITCIDHFSLVLLNAKSYIHSKMDILQEHSTLAEVAARPGSRHFRCLFRVTFVPRDPYDLLRDDTSAFEYFYLQCCNDVIQERFASELKYDMSLKLAALHMQQHFMSNNMTGKISIKAIEKESGLDKFVSRTLVENMKTKDIRKYIAQFLKQNQNLSAPGQKQLTALQAKLHYMKIVSELKTFGTKIFMVTLLDKKSEGMVLVGPKSGISLVTNIKASQTMVLADFEQIMSISVTKEGESMQRVLLEMSGEGQENICLGLLNEDVENFICLVEGYYRIFVNDDATLYPKQSSQNDEADDDLPSYPNKHRVVAAPWSYPADLVSQVIGTGDEDDPSCMSENEHIVDLSKGPPPYKEDEEYIAKIKQELGIQTDEIVKNDVSVPNDFEADLDHSEALTVIPDYEEVVTSFGRESSDDSEKTSLLPATLDSSMESSLDSDSTTSSNTSASTLVSQTIAELEHENILLPFQRYVPSPISSHIKRLKNGHPVPREITPVQPAADDTFLDTDSLTATDLERRPLLSHDDSPLHLLEEHTNLVEAESDDTDSWGTPSDSPAKGPLNNANVDLELEQLPSFGLHSSAQGMSEAQFQKIATSFGLHSPDQLPADVYKALYDPRLFYDKGLYIDPDIIDLTLLPPPKTPDDDLIVDFTSLASLPPPEFSDDEGEPVSQVDLEFSTTSQAKPKSSYSKQNRSTDSAYGIDEDSSKLQTTSEEDEGSDSGNETISSENIDVPASVLEVKPEQTVISDPGDSESMDNFSEIFTADIDDLIAKLTMPPPPPSSDIPTLEGAHCEASWENSAEARIKVPDAFAAFDVFALEEEFARLIIPPPPGLASPTLHDIPIVPPIFPKDYRSRKYQKSSANVLKKCKSLTDNTISNDVPILLESRSLSRDSSPVKSAEPESFNPPLSSSRKNIANGSDLLEVDDVDSPSTVSKKLAQLLRSMPMNAEVEEPLVLSGSLKTNSLLENAPPAEFSNGSRSRLTRSNSLKNSRKRQAPMPPRSNSLSIEGENNTHSDKEDLTDIKDTNSKPISDIVDGPPQTNSASEQNGMTSLSELKSKLQAHRDLLLKKTTNSRQKSRLDNHLVNGHTEQPLKRSNSFSEKSSKGRRSMNRSASVDVPQQNGDSDLTKKLKKTPMMYGMLTLPRSTLRPMADGTGSDSKDLKKIGPVKAHRTPLSLLFALDTVDPPTSGIGTVVKAHAPKVADLTSKGIIMSGIKREPIKVSKKKPAPDTPSTSALDRPVTMRRPTAMNSASSSDAQSPPVPMTTDEIIQEKIVENVDDEIIQEEMPANVDDEIDEPADVESASFSLIHKNHGDFVRGIIDKTYVAETGFQDALVDIEHLLAALKINIESRRESSIDKNDRQFNMCKEELTSQARQFVTDAKLFISSATQTSDKIIPHLNRCLHTLAKLCLHSHSTMLMLKTVYQAQNLGFEVLKVGNSFKSTVNASQFAIGKPLGDPHMKYLMRQTRNLATLLGNLIKMLKTLEHA